MPKITYEIKDFAAPTLAVIAQANEIVADYAAQGFSLTLRQIYYQFVSRGFIENTERSYKRMGNIISDGRRAGMIDWSAIEDRTRYIRERPNWEDPQGVLATACRQFHRDLWAPQDVRVEVWIEKDALIGVIEQVCQDNDLPHFSCRGYVSDSEMWVAAQRMRDYQKEGQSTVVLHLGDHDPSGIDMTRDIRDRLVMFSNEGDIEVRRIALTMDQVEEVGPPPNPAKMTDSRFAGYVKLYGSKSWELDALEPRYLVNLIQEEVDAERNEERWAEAVSEENEQREQIQQIIDRWDEMFPDDEEEKE